MHSFSFIYILYIKKNLLIQKKPFENLAKDNTYNELDRCSIPGKKNYSNSVY